MVLNFYRSLIKSTLHLLEINWLPVRKTQRPSSITEWVILNMLFSTSLLSMINGKQSPRKIIIIFLNFMYILFCGKSANIKSRILS